MVVCSMMIFSLGMVIAPNLIPQFFNIWFSHLLKLTPPLVTQQLSTSNLSTGCWETG